ncbi:MAG TPA: hypothetical protein VHU87_15535 [Rhizomicrobium sp.]|jgi:hypothetical protein|nr:hypothetical protein [Rhizomicrobium sp.]
MLTRFAGQELIDGLSAVTLGASVLGIAQRRAASPLRTRLGFAFGGLFVLFAARTAFYVLDISFLHLLALIVVCTLPLAALVLAEGVLRRHAPGALKILVTLGAVAMAAALLAEDGRAPAASWWLGSYVITSLVTVTVLLLARDRKSLSRQENAGVAALIASGALLTLLSVTDFLPRSPVGLSGIGAAAVGFVLGANPSTARETRRVLVSVLIMGLVAVTGAVLFAAPFGLHGLDEHVRMEAILLALLLATNAVLGVFQREGAGAAQGFAQALAAADRTSLDAFLGSLSGEPLLAGLNLAEGKSLAEYDTIALSNAMAARAVWTRMLLSGGHADIAERAGDELADLMARTEATHAVVLSRMPLRIALLTLPGAGTADGIEVNLALFGALAASLDRP